MNRYFRLSLGCLALVILVGLGLMSFAPAPAALLAQGAVPPAQPPPQFNRQAMLRFRHLTVDDGLPSNQITAMAQTSRGFMWFGTNEGLARYDGYGFIIYKHDPDDAGTLSGNQIGALAEDSAGRLWVATANRGLNRFDAASGRFIRYLPDPANPDAIADATVAGLAIDGAGMLWMQVGGGRDSRLGRFDPQTERFTHYPLQCNGRGMARIRRILIDQPTGVVWLQSDDLARFDPRTEQLTCFNPTANPGSINERTTFRFADMARGSDGLLWLTSSDGLYTFDPAGEEFTRFVLPGAGPPGAAPPPPGDGAPGAGPPAAGGSTSTVYQDAAGLLWVGAIGGRGLFVFDPQAERFIANYTYDPTNPAGLSSAVIGDIYQDREGLLWMSTNSAGVSSLDLRQMQFSGFRLNPLSEPPFPAPGIQGIYEDAAGLIWIGSNDTLVRFDPADGSYTHFLSFSGPLPLSMPRSRMIASIMPDPAGNLWFDGIDGLYRFDPRTETFTGFRDLGLDPGRPRELDYAIQDADSNIWLLANDTLLYFDLASERFTRSIPIHTRPGLQRRGITLARDPSGDVWIGGGGFINRLDSRTGKVASTYHEPRQPGMPDVDVNSIHIDPAGKLWMGTSGGLLSLDPASGAFGQYTTDDGLSSNVIVGVQGDSQGQLWLSTSK
ncbi:MAG TPA: two-component regulator propeller domain-containing protein, partial [Herpetosiphonaceae bacterium]|nr:two-component regulator propeller domain-containing protein [Herpetosiphonaceae bacterium]